MNTFEYNGFVIQGEIEVEILEVSPSKICFLSDLGLPMPINKYNQRRFHNHLYAGQLETITVLKRNDNQQQGTVRSIKLFQCRRSSISKTGETIQGDMNVGSATIWHIPKIEMERTGINHWNPADRIVDSQNRYWQPEAPTRIDEKLFSNHYCLSCLRVDPPSS